MGKRGRKARPLDERLIARREVTANGCWVWLGAKNRQGYGVMSLPVSDDEGERIRMVHRIAYEFWVGRIPDHMVIDHLCRNPACFNPDHLECVSRTENSSRAGRNHPSKKKSMCVNGHELVGDNIKWFGTKRRCRACAIAASAAWREKQRQLKQDASTGIAGTTSEDESS